MSKKTLGSLGIILKTRRSSRGLREVAREIGIGPATLMRVENGHVPDVATFGKVCKWLGEDPSAFLGIRTNPAVTESGTLTVAAHLKANQTNEPATIKALAQMILLAANMQPEPKESGA